MQPMKLNILSNAFLLLLLAGAWSACKEEKLNITVPPVGLGGDSTAKTPTDIFIHDKLTVPYNIAVYYKWQPGMLDFPYEIVPPLESQVQPALEGLIAVTFAPYNDQTGSTNFLRKYLPKTLKLAGTGQYESNGSIILGQAEGGTAMLLYEINKFTRQAKDSGILKDIGHTMHHEFGHILHQNIMYPVSFRSITPGYTGNWFNKTDQEARKEGFISAYAESDPSEDFVEMIATMLIGGRNGLSGYDDYEKIMKEQTGGPNSQSYALLRAKEAAVVDYFARAWKIDFYALQRRCRLALTGYFQ
jgi:substrate import-associated zinc metallohydrolase lipoprotein